MISPSVEQQRRQVAERWRELLYPHLGSELFHDMLADLSEKGWDDVRKEVDAASTLFDTLSRELERMRKEHQELLTRVDSLRLPDTTGSTASTERR